MRINRIISAHEHLGLGKLYFSNGNVAEYNALPKELEKELKLFQRITQCQEFGSILYPQIPYKKYNLQKKYVITSESINSSFLQMVQKLPKEFNYYPFLYLRCTDSKELNKRLLDRYNIAIYGIKVHPDAELVSTEEFLESGILDLAREYALPITVHCSRPGGKFDFYNIKKNIFPELQYYNINFNIAHMGFGDENIFDYVLPEKVYVDLSPLGIILDQYLLLGGKESRYVSKMICFIEQNPKAVMYGEDFPYNIQKWEDNSIHGKDRIADLKFLEEFIFDEDADLIDSIFYNNVKMFMGK